MLLRQRDEEETEKGLADVDESRDDGTEMGDTCVGMGDGNDTIENGGEKGDMSGNGDNEKCSEDEGMEPKRRKCMSGSFTRLYTRSKNDWVRMKAVGSVMRTKIRLSRIKDDVIYGALLHILHPRNVQMLS